MKQGDLYIILDEDLECPERPAAGLRESSEKRRSNRHRRQRVSFLAEAFSDLSTIRLLKVEPLIDPEEGARSVQDTRRICIQPP